TCSSIPLPHQYAILRGERVIRGERERMRLRERFQRSIIADAHVRVAGLERFVERSIRLARELSIAIERAVQAKHASGTQHTPYSLEHLLDFGPAHDVRGVRTENVVDALDGPDLLVHIQLKRTANVRQLRLVEPGFDPRVILGSIRSNPLQVG